MSGVLTIAMVTVREVSRRRLVLALVLLSGVAIALTGWGFSGCPACTTATGRCSRQQTSP